MRKPKRLHLPKAARPQKHPLPRKLRRKLWQLLQMQLRRLEFAVNVMAAAAAEAAQHLVRMAESSREWHIKMLMSSAIMIRPESFLVCTAY